MTRDRRNVWRRASMEVVVIVVAAFVLVGVVVAILYGAEWIAGNCG